MKYQKNYASTRPQMYNKKSRIDKASKAEKAIVDHLGSFKNSTILDIGSSSGIIADYFANKAKKIIGLDIDSKAIEFAKNNNKYKNVIFQYGDAMNMPFAQNTFDIVLCMHVYEHVPDSQKLFDEIYRVLKKDGICYLAAQNSLWPLEPHHNLLFLSYLPKKVADKYINIFKNKKEYYEHPTHYWKLKKMLKKFTITDYTFKILNNPQKYGYKKIPSFLKSFSFVAKYFSPTYIWIIQKK